MNFTVTILGSGSAIPTSRRNPTSQYIQCSNRHLLIDCGEGTQMQMRKYGVKFQRLDCIFISHLHGDHFFGLVGLLSSMHLLGRVKPINIFAPEGLEKIIRLQLEVGSSKLGYEINVIELTPNSEGVIFEDEKITVFNFPLSHKIPTHGFLVVEKEKERSLLVKKAEAHGVLIEYYHKLKAGKNVTRDDGHEYKSEDYTLPGAPEKRFAFCSDTEYFEDILNHIRNVDLLYHEATFTEDLRDRAISTKHSTASDAGRIAQKANVGKLIMGHLSARYDSGEQHVMEAKEFFENCEVVEDGSVFEV